jgi:hypothetical protein
LVFNAVDMSATIAFLEQAVIEWRPCFLSMANLNSLMAAQSDWVFLIPPKVSIYDYVGSVKWRKAVRSRQGRNTKVW